MRKTIIDPFKKWRHFIIANLTLGLIIALFTTNDFSLLDLTFGIIWSTAISVSQWLGHAWLQTQIARRYSWATYPKQRLVLTFISVTLYSILAYAIVQICMHLLVFGSVPKYLYTVNRFWTIPVLISLFISTLISSIGFFRSWQKSVVKEEQLKREMLNYKYEALKNQINPHFMFNSLNVLSELVYEDQHLAVKYIHQFSDMYRYVLESKDHELRPLKEEIAFLEKYVFLLKIRFEDKLTVNLTLSEMEGQLIVPVALQLLVENAVKHNEVSLMHPLVIDITNDKNYISVKNKIHAKIAIESSNQIGLKNLEQQYAFFNETIQVEHSRDIFQVKIPILKSDMP